jgi:hypothetical protein
VIEALAPGCPPKAFRKMSWSQPSTTAHRNDPGRFRVVHPFHPLVGREFELLGYIHAWGQQQRVLYREAGSERTRSLPAAWTDVVGADPFLVLAEGRSLFRVQELLSLVLLVRQLRANAVSEILP